MASHPALTAPIPPLFTLEEAADLLRVDAKELKRFAAAGRIGHYRIGSYFRFDQEQVRSFLDRTRIHLVTERADSDTSADLPANRCTSSRLDVPEPSRTRRTQRLRATLPTVAGAVASRHTTPSKPIRRRNV